MEAAVGLLYNRSNVAWVAATFFVFFGLIVDMVSPFFVTAAAAALGKGMESVWSVNAVRADAAVVTSGVCVCDCGRSRNGGYGAPAGITMPRWCQRGDPSLALSASSASSGRRKKIRTQ